MHFGGVRQTPHRLAACLCDGKDPVVSRALIPAQAQQAPVLKACCSLDNRLWRKPQPGSNNEGWIGPVYAEVAQEVLVHLAHARHGPPDQPLEYAEHLTPPSICLFQRSGHSIVAASFALDARWGRGETARAFAWNQGRAGRVLGDLVGDALMARIGYHCSHEQFPPSELLQLIQAAEAAGFDAAMSSDHFRPWGPAQGQSGYAWSFLGAALQATRLPLGVISAPGYRYHPAILAQAAATLAEMYPGRLWLCLGSGQRLNEDLTGVAWPEKGERNARLRECADAIRALLRGERVSHYGRVTLVDCELYTLPKTPPLLLGAAVSEASAEFVGGWADGLLTVSGKPEQVRRVVEAFRRGGGEGKPLYMQVGLNWASSEDEALWGAHEQWRYNVLGGEVNWELRSPADFDTATRHVKPEDMRGSLLISADLNQHVEWLREYIALGFEELQLHQVDRNQHAFIEAFGAKVLPQLRI
jgi:probable non-F420 flavinoid oxidoreductase